NRELPNRSTRCSVSATSAAVGASLCGRYARPAAHAPARAMSAIAASTRRPGAKNERAPALRSELEIDECTGRGSKHHEADHQQSHCNRESRAAEAGGAALEREQPATQRK